MAMCGLYILVTLSLCCLSSLCSCLDPSYVNQSLANLPARATWYGAPVGAGSIGGACGYKNAVMQPPYSSFVTAIGQSFFKNGQGCGACFQVSCDRRQNPACSGQPVRVVVTDLCPGGPCVTDAVHFDLSGTAFGAMAVHGQEAQLRKAGALQIYYSRVPCQYGNTKIAFRVDEGSNIDYIAVAVEFQSGDGTVAAAALRQGGVNSGWEPMQRSWGNVWKLNPPADLKGPFSIRLTSTSRQTIEATNVIPAAWRAGATYQSSVNFA